MLLTYQFGKDKNVDVYAQSLSCVWVTPWDCSPPDSSVHGIFQARILEWIDIILEIVWENNISYIPGRSINWSNIYGGQFSSVTQSCLTLCDPMDCITPGLPVHHQLPDFTQTHVHWVGDGIQPSHPLSCPSPAFNISQHQGLFQWASSSHQMAKVLEF